MRKSIIKCLALIISVLGSVEVYAQSESQLAHQILNNKKYEVVKEKGLELLKTGFNAGTVYKEVWSRDLNTFVAYSCDVMPHREVREALLRFFYFQGFDGNIPDGYEEIPDDYVVNTYHASTRYDMPGYAFHKNTVETDQETSLIQAVYKYIRETGDRTILQEEVNGRTVLERMAYALDFLMQYRYNKKYGLIWGATTADWGDVQPLPEWGVKYDEYSTAAIDIYDNAMFLIAIDNYLSFLEDGEEIKKWKELQKQTHQLIRKHLWDPEQQKFIPHIYINGCSPFQGIDENEIYYHGGTAVAIQAGLLSDSEIEISLQKMRENVEKSGAQSVGLTIYPVYPEGSFLNKSMVPYGYQNGGDWTWFGARMVTALAENGFIKEAYEEMQPFVDRVIENDGFYEWYSVEGEPHGAGLFRGSAGVMLEAIEALQNWANSVTE